MVGSVYIPPGDTDALDTLDMVIGDILRSHEHLIVCMDANSRNVRCDNSCIGGCFAWTEKCKDGLVS